MITRYKTFGEFMAAILVVHSKNKQGIKIICQVKRYVLLETSNPCWNSEQTKLSFLARLYIAQVLRIKDVSTKIRRMEKYDLLGRRCQHHGDTCVIVNSVQMVETNTGEIDYELTVVNTTNPYKNNPYKILKSKVWITQ